ncbi:hypothetical protein BH10PAT3_BH10PAT3_5250 [soil metagenome]
MTPVMFWHSTTLTPASLPYSIATRSASFLAPFGFTGPELASTYVDTPCCVLPGLTETGSSVGAVDNGNMWAGR